MFWWNLVLPNSGWKNEKESPYVMFWKAVTFTFNVIATLNITSDFAVALNDSWVYLTSSYSRSVHITHATETELLHLVLNNYVEKNYNFSFGVCFQSSLEWELELFVVSSCRDSVLWNETGLLEWRFRRRKGSGNGKCQ